GGSLLGAYYCAEGNAGLRRYVEGGLLYNAVFYGSMVNSALVEAVVDRELGGVRIDELEVRFVPLTTALTDSGPPQARAVVGGTLGEGVRASGSAPVLVAPTDKGNVRYTDGLSASIIPVQAARDYGADFVIACNSIPGPNQRNPFRAYP